MYLTISSWIKKDLILKTSQYINLSQNISMPFIILSRNSWIMSCNIYFVANPMPRTYNLDGIKYNSSLNAQCLRFDLSESLAWTRNKEARCSVIFEAMKNPCGFESQLLINLLFFSYSIISYPFKLPYHVLSNIPSLYF